MTDLSSCFCIRFSILTYISLDSARYRHNYVPLCGVSTLQEPFGILRLIRLCGYGINRATLEEPFGIVPRLIGLCGYGIRRVVMNIDERDILPRIIINELD